MEKTSPEAARERERRGEGGTGPDEDRTAQSARGKNGPERLVAVDWSGSGVWATFDGAEVGTWANMEALLDELERRGGTYQVVVEATFESYEVERRELLVARARSDGHEIVGFRPHHTARRREELGLTKSDINDACVIWNLAEEGRVWAYPILDPDPGWAAYRESVNHEYMQIRAAGEKGLLVGEAKAIIGPWRSRRDELGALGASSGSGYMPSGLAAACFAAKHVSSRENFERILGLHGSGYPGILRSEIHHHSYRWAARRGIEWGEFRRALRRVYALLKEAREEVAGFVCGAEHPGSEVYCVCSRHRSGQHPQR